MKEIIETVTIQNCTSNDFFRLIYEDVNLLQRFHAEINKDDNAEVPEWDNGSRTISFHTPANAPAVISRLIGADTITIIETQSFSVSTDGVITLESVPVPQIPGASNFSSTATITIKNTPLGRSCTITACVRVTAAGPYGLVSLIENYMSDSARHSLVQFLTYCAEYIDAMREEPSIEGSEEAPSTALGEFYDAEEERMSIDMDRSSLDNEVIVSPSSSVSLEILAGYMREVVRKSNQISDVVENINARLARLEEVELAKSAAIVRSRKPSGSWSGWLEDLSPPRAALLAAGLVVSTAAVTAALCWRGPRSRGGT